VARISISAELGDAWISVCKVSRDVLVRAKTHSLDEGVRRLAEFRCRDSGKRYKNPNRGVLLCLVRRYSSLSRLSQHLSGAMSVDRG
jgi:hypothetical protein